MSLTDPEGNKPGGVIGYTSYQRKYTYGHTGFVQTENRTVVRYSRNRTSNQSRPVRILPGTNTPWRDPSTYARNIIWHIDAPLTTWYRYGSDRVDTEETMCSQLLGNNPKLHEFLPLFPSGGYDRPVYDYNDYARAITECLIKIGDGKANLAESIATHRQTVNMLADRASDLFRALIAVKRGRWGLVPKQFGFHKPGAAANLLLEYKFGWQPLMGDIKAVYDELASEEPSAKFISARRVIPGTVEVTNFQLGGDGRPLDWNTKSNYKTTCHLVGRLSDEWLRRGTQFGLGNPAALAWELVPWSFVVDWAIPIGNVLQAFTAPAGLTFVGGYTSAVTQGRKKIQIGSPSIPTQWSTGGTYVVERFGFRRDALAGWPMPLPYVKSPYSNSHTLTALALLRQLMK